MISPEDLFWEILRFLWSCKPKNPHDRMYCMKNIRPIQENVLEGIATGQQIIIRDDRGEIEHYLSYWKVSDADIELLQKGIKPDDRTTGNRLYIAEHGNKGGRKSLTRVIRLLRELAGNDLSGVLWHSCHGGKFYYYANQKGACNVMD